jgi:tetratricopeptide (TPR) repeat protein
MTVPDTIQGMLMARIDRLPEAAKRLLQTASILGREFSPRLLSAIWDGDETLQPLLLDLKHLEFLYEHRSGEESTYVFKHALTQEVAYDSLLTTRKQALHAMAGQTLESLYAGHLEEAYDRLAYHYARTDHAAKAVEYLRLSAERAARAYAHAEAAATLQDALVHAEQLAGQERDRCCLDLAIRQADSLFFLGRHQELVTLLQGQQARLERLDEPLLNGLYYLALGHAYSYLGERQLAIDSLQRALDEGTRCHDVVTMGRAHTLLTLEHSFAGRFQQGMYHGEQAVTLLEQTEDHAWLGLALYYHGEAYWWSGQLHHILESGNRLYTLGETVGDRRLQTNGLTASGIAYTALGECEAAIEVLEHACAISPDAFERSVTLGLLGYAYLEKGDHGKAIDTLQQAVEEAQQYRSPQVQSWFNTYLAEAYLLDAQVEKASDHARRAMTLAEDIEHPWGAALANRTLGRVAHRTGNLTEAEMHLQAALAQLATIQSRFEQALTLLDLGALAHTRGNRDTATTHLRTAPFSSAKAVCPMVQSSGAVACGDGSLHPRTRPACGSPRASVRRPTTFLRRCTTGLPKDLTRRICRMPKPCCKNSKGEPEPSWWSWCVRPTRNNVLSRTHLMPRLCSG